MLFSFLSKFNSLAVKTMYVYNLMKTGGYFIIYALDCCWGRNQRDLAASSLEVHFGMRKHVRVMEQTFPDLIVHQNMQGEEFPP